jgi:hypothetical protein
MHRRRPIRTAFTCSFCGNAETRSARSSPAPVSTFATSASSAPWASWRSPDRSSSLAHRSGVHAGDEACELTYREEKGREFIIPPGTHCDLVLIKEIAPGEWPR